MKRKLKENKKKGFTLVELIVVLVILAILAALLVPALVGYIDKAKKKQIIAETRACVMAAQTLADEEYAKGKSDSDIQTFVNTASNVKDLAESTADPVADSIIISKGKVTVLKYALPGSGLTCEYKVDWSGAAAGHPTDGKYDVTSTP